MTKHELELENALLGQLKITKDDLKTWNDDMYLMDSQTVYRFWQYIENAPAVAIVGDYDCDGICASYILGAAIKSKFPGKRTSIRIPKRKAEGYGLNPAIADEFINGTPATDKRAAYPPLPKDSLVITVDNGIAAAPVLEQLQNAGFKVIVTDHHELGTNKLPKVDMIMDPAVDGICDAFNGRYWCGAAIAYKLSEQVIPMELADKLAVYAGLATIADCMPLKEGNWGLVKKAIRSFREKTSPEPLNQLLLGMRQQPEYANAETFGFYLGPAFNAAGRLHDDGPKLILSYLFKPDQEKCDRIISYNETRKKLRDAEYEKVKEQIINTNQQNNCPIWVAVSGLHEGIVGILAGKATEDFGTPTIVLTESDENPGILKGSARSIPGINIFEFLVKHSDLFTKFGGHEGAAGLSMPIENFEKAKQAQMPNNMRALKQETPYMKIAQEEIPVLLPIVEEFSPYGEGNPVPHFAVDIDMISDGAEMFGSDKNHLKIDRTKDGYRIIHFFHEPNELSDKGSFGLIGTISLDGFRGASFASFNADEATDIHSDEEKTR